LATRPDPVMTTVTPAPCEDVLREALALVVLWLEVACVVVDAVVVWASVGSVSDRLARTNTATNAIIKTHLTLTR